MTNDPTDPAVKPDADAVCLTPAEGRLQMELLQRSVADDLRSIVDDLGVGDAIEFTGWLIRFARDLGGYSADAATKLY